MTQQDNPLPYLQRIKSYYLALGYAQPYRWAHFSDVPFSLLTKPLKKSRIGLVTTAARFCEKCGDQGPGAPYNAAAKFFNVYAEPTAGDPKVFISHVGYDRNHTIAEDQGSWFPLQQLKRAAKFGIIGAVSERFYGLPTNRSQATTLERDAPELLRLCRQDAVDAALLVANCPVCHQCCCLGARHLEQNGIATVVLGCAKDIVEHVGVPRFLFSDFPLGNAAGKPNDLESQQRILELAFYLLESAQSPRTTHQSPFQWSDDSSWKRDFYNIDNLSADELAALREKFDRDKAVAKKQRQAVGL
jgi:D-proline reductase (dithiol) PrdB